MNNLLAFVVLWFGSLTLHAATSTAEENAAAATWPQSIVYANPERPAFSFTLGGKLSGALLRDWKRTDVTRELDPQRRERTLTWIDAAAGLQLRLVATQYVDFPVVEWTLWSGNTDAKFTDHDTITLSENPAAALLVLRGFK
jgi:hypothetical protein